jgi:hypothetical protein
MRGSKVDMLPGVELTDRVLLEKAIERLPKVKRLVLIEENSEGEVHIYSSKMTMGDAAWLKVQFDKQFGP